MLDTQEGCQERILIPGDNFITIKMQYLNILITLLSPFMMHRYEIMPRVSQIQQVVWLSYNNVAIVKDKDILIYSFSDSKVEKIGEREENDFVGIDSDNNISLCRIEHFIIDSKDDFSTKFTVNGKELYFFETIRPIWMYKEKIVAVTAMDFLETHYYEIDINTGETREIDPPREKTYLINIPKNLIIKKGYFLNSNRYILEDIWGNLYLKRYYFSTNTFSSFFKLIMKKMYRNMVESSWIENVTHIIQI